MLHCYVSVAAQNGQTALKRTRDKLSVTPLNPINVFWAKSSREELVALTLLATTPYTCLHWRCVEL